MIMVVLHYPALLPTVEALRADKEKELPFFENEIPGLIDKTWGTNEETGRGASVYHFEDRASADAWFNSDRQRTFRKRTARQSNISTLRPLRSGAPSWLREQEGVTV